RWKTSDGRCGGRRSRDAVDWAFVVDREPRRRCDRHYRRLERAVLESYIGETAREIFRMARVFVTGSADGPGKMAAELLIEQGYKVVLHARSAARGRDPQEGRRRRAHRRRRPFQHRGDEIRRRP